MPGNKARDTRPDRYALLLVGLAVLLLSLGGRLVQLQGFESAAFAKKAADQRLRDMTITPSRGTIYDREGEPLATSVAARTVYAVPTLVQDATATAGTLAATLGGDQADYLRKLHKKSSFVYIARKVPIDRAARLDAMKIKGLGLLEDSKRTYPSGDLASQVLGFVGIDDSGLAGLEKQYDALLGGKPGSVLAERDPFGMPIPGGVMRTVDKVDGRAIVLTIDKDIQYEAQSELAKTVRDFGAKSGSAIVLDPRTGEIYAMASVPTFDPNDFRNADPRAITNRPVSATYEPGSTIKPFAAAASIDSGLFTPDSMFHLPETITVGGRVIHEAHERGAVDWSLANIIAQSSNVGAVRVGLALGKQRIFDYYTRFGMGVKTGIDFPGEARGVLPAPDSWSSSSIGNIPFGQGMSVTPLQLARALSAIADGGVLTTPHLLRSVPGDEHQPAWPTQRVISAKTASAMRGVLEGVVTGGTGTAAQVPGYRVAGKTGTAQVAKYGHYASGAYVASFAGFLPAEDPRVLVVVVVEEPSASIFGGTVAAPAFKRIAQFSVNHLRIAPSVTGTGTPDSSAKSKDVAHD